MTLGTREVQVPAGSHITVHYTVWEEEWCDHLAELRGEPDWGPVIEEVDPGQIRARYRRGFTSYVAHCLDPSKGLGGGNPPWPVTDAPRRSETVA